LILINDFFVIDAISSGYIFLLQFHYDIMADSLTTYDELNEDIQFTEEETKALLKLNEKEILILILSEMKKQTELLSEK
jgi:hypothetical protein